MSDAPLLETSGLTMRFGGVVAVSDVNLSVGASELRCLIGPNGAGKSTFFKMLTGQLKPTAGAIKFAGMDITRAEPHHIARRGIGIKMQVPNVFNGASVAENIFVAALRRRSLADARRKAEEVMERLDLRRMSAATVGQLAHGARQHVEIGMVIAQDPRLILLDEPTAGMTADEVVRTAELIREISKNRALVVVEHDMQFIRLLATTVTVFSQGRVLIEADVDTVLSDERVRDVYLGKQTA